MEECIDCNKEISNRSQGRCKSCSNRFRKGKYKLSEKTKENISKARKGVGHHNMPHSETTKKNISIAHTGKHYPKLSEALKGEKHPNWKGGISFEKYPPEFNNRFKRAIRKRDNYICMLCGIHKEKLNRALEVHHVNYDKKLNIPQNCISLDHKCNIKANSNRKIASGSSGSYNGFV